MKIIKILILTFITLSSFAKRSPSDCPGLSKLTSNYYEKMLNYYEKKSEKQEVSSITEFFSESFSFYCKDKKYQKSLTDSIVEINKKGALSEARELKKEILRAVKYRFPQDKIDKLTQIDKDLKEKVITEDFFKKIMKNYSDSKTNREKIKKTCTAVSQEGNKISKYPRDQDGIGWCYAFTAADLISFKTGENISAFDLANSYNNDGTVSRFFQFLFTSNESDKEGGYIDDAIESSLEKGACLESDLSSEYKFLEFSRFKAELEEIELLKDRFDEQTKVVSKERITSSKFKYKSRMTNAMKKEKEKKINEFIGNCSILNAPWRTLFKNLTDSDVILALKESKKNEILEKLVELNCKNKRVQLKGTFSIVDKTSSPDKLILSIDKQLDEGNILGISYYSSFLSEPRSDLSGPHASSIVGRKFDEKSGACLYQIRNSWGECSDSISKEHTCENGNQWVKQEQLERALMGVTYLK